MRCLCQNFAEGVAELSDWNDLQVLLILSHISKKLTMYYQHV